MAKITFVLPGVESSVASSRVGPAATRGAAAGVDPLLADVTVEKHYDLSAATRAAAPTTEITVDDDALLALEMEDGFVLYTSAARLADTLQRKQPGAARGGSLRLDILRGEGPTTRGLGDWLVRALSIVGIDDAALRDAAVAKAKEWLGDKAGELAENGVSWLGTKALLWVVEERGGRRPGLYRWEGAGDPAAGDPLAVITDWKRDEPLLVFIHGTGSSTLGSFGSLTEQRAADDWAALRERFGRHIYAFEHKTFSESPIENARALAQALPEGAPVSLVTHSRGGLVGDLLGMARLGDDLLDGFHRADAALAEADDADRQQLRALRDTLAGKALRIERYVRVASPARGTLLAGAHLDAFLSSLLYLIGLVPWLQGPAYAVAKRVVLQIVKNRTRPQLVPGIEAMLPESPLAALLGRADPQEGAAIAVIAGDIEGGSLLKRLGAFLTDHLIFENADNDLVVDTDSMYGGIARVGGRYLFDQGADVSHFRYFQNAPTRRALQRWLTADAPAALPDFNDLARRPVDLARAARAAGGERPVVVLLPGILGSHLKVAPDDRVWFDFLDLAAGGIDKLHYGATGIVPDDLFGSVYDELHEFLAGSHDVRRFAYDWRRPLSDAAERLAELVSAELARTTQPVRLVTHSMGGLVVRMLIANHRAVWDALAKRDGASWVMLGTPNRGSHGTVETLLGISDTVRQLARLDLEHSMQQLLDLLAAFPGGVQLLPRPGFVDAGETRDYYEVAEWHALRDANHDFWFGDHLGGLPAAALLDATAAAWATMSEQLPNVERIAYVAGYGHPTPCGVVLDGDGDAARLRMVGTTAGDGTVSHASSVLECLRSGGRVWYAPTDHVGLVTDESWFPAILDLLQQGTTTRLWTAPPALRGGAPATFRYDAGPVLYPTEEGLARSAAGGRRPARRTRRDEYTLAVSCRAMDLRWARDPIVVGHYAGDAIAAAEAVIDRQLDGALALRNHLGQYAGPRGTTAVVLIDPSAEEAQAGRQAGAVVVGLGQYDGRLTPTALADCVRAGVVRYLLQIVDRGGGRLPTDVEPRELGLASLLLGYNSTTGISIDDSVQAIVRGVMQANREFCDATDCRMRVTRLELVELFVHRAVTAATAVSQLEKRLADDARRLGCRIDAQQVLDRHWSGRVQFEAGTADGYWPRLIITDADREDDTCPPECLDEERLAEASTPKLPTHPSRRPELAERLRFVLVSQRARAEVVVTQRQPGLAETLVESCIRNTTFLDQTAQLARTLFELLVPLDLKETVRQSGNLVLVVDGYTANLPWEMLVADDEPLIARTAIVRQFQTTRFRRQVRTTLTKNAYVVGNPSTEGFYTAFPDPQLAQAPPSLPSLEGAEKEADAVKELLETSGYSVARLPANPRAIDVINGLFQHDYRILHVSAHGMFQAGEGTAARSGVVLSDGLLLTAAEIGQLEVVPDLVFLNCCFLGTMDNQPAADQRPTAYNRLAYSLARELIEIGVRAVVVAGWAVDDRAAECFARSFYAAMVRDGLPFGRAVHAARQDTLRDYADSNTWGAYQAYGDPDFLLDPSSSHARHRDDGGPVAPEQVIAPIDALWVDAHDAKTDAERSRLRAKLERLAKDVPAAWRMRPDVLYAQARCYAEIRAFDDAMTCYRQALASESDGDVPVHAIEQLANLEARHGGEEPDETLVRQAINRLLALTGDGSVTSERAALLGSAYKRLALCLREHWRSPDRDEERQPRSAEGALALSIRWYREREGAPGQADFRPYSLLNRLALEAVLGRAPADGADLALRAGDEARARYPTSRDYFDLIMAADALLTARLIDGSLADPARAATAVAEIIARYTGSREHAPESARELASVADHLRILARLFESRTTPPADPRLAQRLRDIANALAPAAQSVAPPSAPPPGRPPRGRSTAARARKATGKPRARRPRKPRRKP